MSEIIALKIRTENSYATGAVFTHVLAVEVPPPPSDDLDDWAQDQLLSFTGEGPQYADVPAIYEVEILSAPAEFAHLVSLTASAEG
ncbi:hypothetical protein [Gordonia malaquae]|uniref:hypothetical protein n=1 Tax=Gordonia malaquae TaxID=410332 RepID=UPI00034D70DD|nr:hypothetical protein [Gordonia malaquae]